MGRRYGFTLLEMLVVIAVGGILAAVAVASFGGIQGQMGVRGAQNALLSMHAQTRALAVERGGRARLMVESGTGNVVIDLLTDPAGVPTVIERRNFPALYNVTVTTEPAPVVVCMTPRGYADPGCNSYGQRGIVRISGRGGSSQVDFLPLGQAVLP